MPADFTNEPLYALGPVCDVILISSADFVLDEDGIPAADYEEKGVNFEGDWPELTPGSFIVTPHRSGPSMLLTPAEFDQNYLSSPKHSLAISMQEPFRGRQEGNILVTEAGEMPIAGLVRCGRNGEPIVEADAGLLVQWCRLIRFEGEGGAHQQALRSQREYEGADIADKPAADRLQFHPYDILSSGKTDTLSDGEAAQQRFGQAADDEDPWSAIDMTIEASRLPPVGQWPEIRHTPQYMNPSVRAFGRDMLLPHLKGFPMDNARIMVLRTGHPEEAIIRNWVLSAEDSVTLAPLTHPGMPGYQTSDVLKGNRSGVTFLMFSDMAMTSVFCWPEKIPAKPLFAF